MLVQPHHDRGPLGNSQTTSPSAQTDGQYIIGVDVGGTCTDCVILDGEGKVHVSKTFSTPRDFSEGMLDAVELGARELGMDLKALFGKTRLFLHATTVAENAIFTGDLVAGGLLITRGFEETLVLMRGGYAEWAGRTEEEMKNVPYVYKPPPMIPIRLTRGIKERVDSVGNILAPADSEDVLTAAANLLEAGANAIGISFLWSFANPANEIAAARAIRERYPQLFVTLSHEIAPVIGEFERSQTVGLNIRLGPVVSEYLRRLQDRLRDKGYLGQTLVMQAYGGLLAADAASKRPVGLIESGPVSGLVGSKELGRTLGYKDIIGIDMGGTTFKAGVVSDGSIDYAREPMVAGYHYSSPKMNIQSIGLAGGSIVSLDPETATPRVGPRSAGALPGPVCYDRGGEEPTITDVDLLLGYLDPRYFLGGREAIDQTKAQKAFEALVAEPLSLGVLEAAGEVYRLANSLIYDMLHKLTVERGLDPRNYVMFSTGGTAGMHVSVVGPELNVKKIIVPNSASVHSALGLVTSDITHEEQVTRAIRPSSGTDEVNTVFNELAERVRDRLTSDGFKEEDILLSRSIEMRYRRQVHVVAATVDTDGELTEQDVVATVNEFERLYEERFGAGSGFREAGIEMINFRVRGRGLLRKPEITGHSKSGSDPSAALIETRDAYFGPLRGVAEARCYDFQLLAPGNRVEGPAIVWTPITTIVINPGQVSRCDQYKNIEISW